MALTLITSALGLSTEPVSAHEASSPIASRVTERVSVSGVGASEDSGAPAISGDGNVVAFASGAPLIENDTNNHFDVYVRDLSATTTVRASIGLHDEDSNQQSFFPSLSLDGRYVAFASMASNLVVGDTNDVADVFVYDRVTNESERVSVSSQGRQSEDGGFEAMAPSISSDGRYVSFVSRASNLVEGDTNNAADVFVHDRHTGDTRRVSIDSTGTQANGPSGFHAISGDGHIVTFGSAASNLVTDDTNAVIDVFVHNLATSTTTRVSRALAGANTNGPSNTPAISNDGRFVGFSSAASNLVTDDTNGLDDTFVVDLQTDLIERVSVDSNGIEANGKSFGASGDLSFGLTLSGDGRFVAFVSVASNLVANDGDGQLDVFVRDREQGVTEQIPVPTDDLQVENNSESALPSISHDGKYVAFTAGGFGFADVFLHNRDLATTDLVSVTPPDIEARGESFLPAIAKGGRIVAFTSSADNIAPDGGRYHQGDQIYVRNRDDRTTELISARPDGRAGNDESFQPAITPDGRFVAFASRASDLDPNYPYARDSQIYVHDRYTDVTEIVSVGPDGADGDSISASLSADGRYVSFFSDSSNLVENDTNDEWDVFVADRVTNRIERVSVSSDGTERERVYDYNGSYSLLPSISADGNVVVFSSESSNLVEGDTNNLADVFAHDRRTHRTERISVSSAGDQADDESIIGAPDDVWINAQTSVSGNGRYVTFSSIATNLIADDTNWMPDVFVHDRVTNTTERVSVAQNGAESSGFSFQSTISANGNRVAFMSMADDLVAGDTNDAFDIFLFDRSIKETWRISVNSDLEESNYDSFSAAVSPDGNSVAFTSFADNLVARDTNQESDVFVHDSVEGSDGFIDRPAEELYGFRKAGSYSNDPVNAATGNFTTSETDLSFPVAGLDLTRTYNAGNAADGPFGQGWSPNFAAHVHENAGGTVTFVDADGRIVSFTPKPPTSGGPNPIGTDGYDRPEEMFADLFKMNDGSFELRYFSGETWVFNADGRLSKIRSWDDTSVTFAYDASDKLVSITHSTGPSLSFIYGGSHVTRVEASDGRVVSYGYDAPGNLSSVTDPLGGVSTYRHDTDGRITKITGPDGHVVVENTYDSRGRVLGQQMASGASATFAYNDETGRTTVTDATTGAVVVYIHDTEGRLTGIVDPYGFSLLKTYDDNGNLIDVVDRLGAGSSQSFDAHANLLSSTGPGGVTQTFTYDTLDRMLTATDAAGNVTTYGYDSDERIASQVTDANWAISAFNVRDGLVVSQTDPDGVTTTHTYDTARQLIASTDEVGNVTRYAYDESGNVVSVTSPLGHVTTTTYNAKRQVLTETDATGAMTSNEYAVNGALLKTTDPTGAVSTMAYDAAGHLASETDANGAVTTYHYDAHDNLVEVQSPGGATTHSTFDAMGRLLTATNSTGGVTTYGYDADGNQVKVTDPTGAVSSRTLDMRGREIESTDALGRITRTEYDVLDRVIATTDPAGAVTRTVYDAVGNVIESIDPTDARSISRYSPAGRIAQEIDANANATTYRYDPAGRPIGVTDPLANVVRTVYDADGNVTSETSPTGLVTRFRYDPAGRQTELHDPHGGISRTAYSSRGEVVEEKDPTGATQRFAYDPVGNLLSATDANGGVTRFTFDARRNRTSMVDQNERQTTFTYDTSNRLTAKTDPLGRTTSYAYDARGALTAIADPSGRSEARAYDATGQLTSRTFGDGSAVTFSYDAVGRRTAMTDAMGTTRNAYDPMGRLVSVTHPDGSVVRSTFDQVGNRTALTYPDATTATFRYDKANRLVGLAHPQAGTVNYTLDAEGRLTNEALPNVASSGGWSRKYGYTNDLMTSFTETRGNQRTATTLGHDPTGRIITEATNGKTKRYAYDLAGQLTKSSSGDDESVTYRYDKVGNRIAMTDDDDTTTYRYDVAGQLTQSKQDSDLTKFSYDPAGRLISEQSPEAVTTRTYNARGLLAQRVVKGDDDDPMAWDYTHDGDGTLVALATTQTGGDNDDDDNDGESGGSSARHRFTWDTNAEVPEILAWSTNGVNTDLLYGYGRAVALRGGKATVFSKDAYGSVLARGNSDLLSMATSYDTWGNPGDGGDDDDGADTIGPRFGYRGELHLGDDVHLRARQYDPSTGRFTTTDPLDGVDGMTTVANPYPYAYNDPLNRVDPSGLRPPTDSAYEPPKAKPCSNLFHEMTVLQIENAMRAVVGEPCGFMKPKWHPPETRYGTKAAPKLAAKPTGDCSGDFIKYAVSIALFRPLVGTDLAHQANKNFADACDSHDYAYDLLRYADFAGVWHSNILKQRKIADGVFNEMAGRVCGKTGYVGIHWDKARCQVARRGFYEALKAWTWIEGAVPS